MSVIPVAPSTPDRPEQPKWKRLESGTTLVSQRLKKRTYDASRRFGVGLTLSSTSRIRKKSSSSSRQPDQRRCQGFDRSVTAISVACRYLNGRSDRPRIEIGSTPCGRTGNRLSMTMVWPRQVRHFFRLDCYGLDSQGISEAGRRCHLGRPCDAGAGCSVGDCANTRRRGRHCLRRS
jgi:hypothetical protein